jgi:hypothetical protein
MKLQTDVGEIRYGQDFASLSTPALRGVSPLLVPASRLVPLPGREITDRQLRVQFLLAF